MKRIQTVDELYGWLTAATAGDLAIYHIGSLANDRANERVAKLADALFWMSTSTVIQKPNTSSESHVKGYGVVQLTQQRLDEQMWRYIARLLRTVEAQEIVHMMTNIPTPKRRSA